MNDTNLAPEPLFPDLTRDDVFRLETPRLWLRWPRHSDAAALVAFASLKPVAEMTGTWAHPLPDGEAERRIFEARKANATGAKLILALTPCARPNLQIGTIGISRSSRAASEADVEIGYMLHPDFWGQGLVVEAVQAMLNTVFSYTGTQAVGAWARVINPASRRVLEKCGFRHSGSALLDQPARGGMVPCDQFVLDRKAWGALISWGQAAPARPVPKLAVSTPDASAALLSASIAPHAC
ncbi:MAG: GNAT family N-acetyltransferase [Bosea sp. (in: a-proteobacteria)]